jgi:hypothetical protein
LTGLDLTILIPQNEPVDVALDGAGAPGQGEPGGDGVVVAAQVGGEGGQGREGVAFGGGDPGVEAVAVAAGHHGGEGPDVAGEPVEVGVAAADAAQLGGVAGVEVIGAGHDPGGDLAHGGRFAGRAGGVAAVVAELVQVALDGEFAAAVAELADLAEQLGGVALAFVPALVQVPGIGVDQVGALLGLGDQVIDAAGGGELAHGRRVQPEFAADRCLGHSLGVQALDCVVVLAHPGDDLLLPGWLHRGWRLAGGGDGVAQMRAAGVDGLFHCLAEVLPQVETVGDLHGLRRALPGAFAIAA